MSATRTMTADERKALEEGFATARNLGNARAVLSPSLPNGPTPRHSAQRRGTVWRQSMVANKDRSATWLRA